MACTRTDAELKRLLVPELATRITAFEEPYGVWIKRFWTTGARFDSVHWARKASLFDTFPTISLNGYLMLSLAMLLHTGLHDISGGVHADGTHPQHFRRACGPPFVSDLFRGRSHLA